MFVIPIGTRQSGELGAPRLALGLGALLVAVHVALSGAIDAGVRAERDATVAVVSVFAAAPHVTVPNDVIEASDPSFRAAADRSRSFKATIDARGGPRPSDDPRMDAVRRVEAQLANRGKAPPAPFESEDAFEAAYAETTELSRTEDQARFDAAIALWREARSSSLRRQLGFSPQAPTATGAFLHMFLTLDWIALIFAACLIVVAVAGLLEFWPGWLVVALALAGGLVGAAALFVSAPPSDTVYAGPEAAIAALLGAFAVRLRNQPIRFAAVRSSIANARVFEAPAGLMLVFWVLGVGLQYLRSDGSAHIAAVLASFVFGVASAFAIRRAGVEAEESESGAESLLSRELARKRERWGLDVPNSEAGLKRADEGRALDFLVPDPEVEASLEPEAPAPQPTAEWVPPPRHAPPRPSASPWAPDPGPPPIPHAAASAPANQTRIARPLPPRDAPVALPPDAPPAPSPQEDRGRMSLTPPDELEFELPPLEELPKHPPPFAPRLPPPKPLPTIPRPTYSVAFRGPDVQAVPEAVRVKADAIAMTLPVAIRTDDNRQILTAYTRSGEESVSGLDPNEAIRLARALDAEGYTAAALAATRQAAAREPRGPYAARALLLEARFLLALEDKASTRAVLEDILSRFPGDPVRDLAKEMLADLDG